MSIQIETRVEAKRGCGYRKPGGMYMVSSGSALPCGKLPIALTVCPCCSAGIKPSRGFTWVSSDLIKNAICASSKCRNCPVFDGRIEKFGLLWIGESFYKKPLDFIRESERLGISRRIPHLPNDFVVGETVIFLAHRKAIKNHPEADEEYTPGIFRTFVPERIEYIVKGTETERELKNLAKRGFTLVKVIPDNEAQTSLLNEEENVNN